VDYSGLVNLNATTATEQMTRVSKFLTGLAKSLGIVMVQVAQLNRAADARDERTPKLSDLRDSGQIEQDADVVLFPFRRDYYRSNPAEHDGLAEIHVAKARDGVRGDFATLEFDAPRQRFREPAEPVSGTLPTFDDPHQREAA
jgi:replicative DNA helicase